MKIKKKAVQSFLHIIIIILFTIVFVSVFYNGDERDYKTESALLREADDFEIFNGVFIRDETVVEYEGEGAVSYSVPDGGRLANNSIIAEIYSSASEIQINRQIEELESELELLKKIQNPGTLQSAQPSNLSVLIEEQYRNLIYSRDVKNYDAISEREEKLLIYMSTYQLLTDDEVSFADRIAEITSEINQLKLAEKTVPIDTITVDHSAYFVSYCDGYETELKKENITELTVDYLKNVQDEKISDENIIGKIIESYDWYMAGIIDNTDNKYETGDRVKIKIESSPKEYTAEVIYITDEGDPSESIVVVSSNEFDSDLVKHRCERTELIKGSYKGLKVPRKAIRFKDIEETVEDENGNETTVTESYKGVYILQGEQVVFRKLDVIYEGNDYVLSNPEPEESGYLALYDDIIVEGVDSNGK